jgi:hypothetical protein
MSRGDVALFTREGQIFSVGTVVKKIHNRQLARQLWGEDNDGDTWEFMYFLENIRPVSVSYQQFNAAVGYKENNIIRGFNVLTEEQSAAVLQKLNLGTSENPQEIELKKIGRVLAETGEFDVENEGEGRKQVLSSICRRQGQPEFRRKLIEAYSGRCAISRCDVVETLEAAHITPYNGPTTNHPANGLLLRADLHVLFDLLLIAVDPATLRVIIAPKLKNSSYSEFEGKTLNLPLQAHLRPSVGALQKHLDECGL